VRRRKPNRGPASSNKIDKLKTRVGLARASERDAELKEDANKARAPTRQTLHESRISSRDVDQSSVPPPAALILGWSQFFRGGSKKSLARAVPERRGPVTVLSPRSRLPRSSSFSFRESMANLLDASRPT
jgi:hypothetical protein